MLDCSTERVPNVTEIKRLRCLVALPAAWQQDFELEGPTPPMPGCKRRYPRIRCRGKEKIIGLEHRQSLPGLPRAHGWFAVYLTDIARGGIGFIHGEALYPKERLRVVLINGMVKEIEIVRCERIDSRCYNIGARFIEQA